MDRTAILGDTIDYMKELLDKIQKLKEEGLDENMSQITFIGNYLKELKPNEVLVRNPPKVDTLIMHILYAFYFSFVLTIFICFPF